MKAKVLITMDDGSTQEFEAYVQSMQIEQSMPDVQEIFSLGSSEIFKTYGPQPPTEINLSMTTQKPITVSVAEMQKVQREMKKLGPRKVIIDESPKQGDRDEL